MKNLVLGMVLGAAIASLGSYLYFPKFKQAAYDDGYSIGNKEGIAKGTALGIDEGIAQSATKQLADQKMMQDSMNAVIEKVKASSRIIIRKPKEEKPLIQNWRVLGGQIAEPIADQPQEKEEKKEK
jgi:hypothetical protein